MFAVVARTQEASVSKKHIHTEQENMLSKSDTNIFVDE